MTKLKRSVAKTIGRYLVLVLVAGVVASIIAVAASTWQDRQFRRKQIADMRELQAKSITEGPLGPEQFNPVTAVSRPPLVTGFEILSAGEVAGQIDDDETVLAVSINGEARAYPINIMTGPDREVFNDTLGGRAIAATW
jgi:hypothetical protein